MKKKLLGILCEICTICMLIPMTISADTTSDGKFEYTVSGDTVTITRYNETNTVVEIPDTIDGKIVTAIGNYAFDGKSLTSITIPNTVTSVGKYAFRETNLTNVRIPGSVENIEQSTFSGCSNLTDVTIENGVKSIGISAFQNCTSLTNITIPDSVESIDRSAFNGCTSLKEFQVEDYNSNYSSLNGVLFDKYQTKLIRYPQGSTETSYSIPGTVTSIGDNAFFCCNNLTNIMIPNSVTSIGIYAFQYTNLTNVRIPGSVENIELSAFLGCSNLTDVTIENGVKSIATSAFQNCTSLTNITIPASVTYIDCTSFNGCTSLKEFQVEDYNSNYSSLNGVLFNRNQTELIRYPQGSTETSYSIPGTVTSIGDNAFICCNNLTNITIPASVTSIGNNAFYGCNNLTNITIPASVKSIGINAFSDCFNLTSIVIPNNVTSIGIDAFMGCRLQSIFLPNGLNVYEASILPTTTQVRYSLNNDKVTIISISGEGKIDLPETICGYPVVAVTEGLFNRISSHTCYYEWTKHDGKYSGQCGICHETIEEKDIPAIVINAPDKVCRTQDTVVSVSVSEGISEATLKYEFSGIGSVLDTTIENGKLEGVLHSSGYVDEDKFNVIVTATTSDGYTFDTIKTVQILNNHVLKHISAKDATVTEEGNKEYWQCTVCEEYFSDEKGTNEISFEDIVMSKLAPEIIKGKGQSVTQGTKKELSFTSNASIDDFMYVKFDGEELDSSKYTVKSGSIVVTLNKDFVSTLKAGKHTISIVSESGEATTEFEVVKKEAVKDSNKTNTGLIGNAGLWISMMASSINAMLIGIVLKKKRK